MWLGALEHALMRIVEFGADALIISLGLDTHEADPLKGGAMTTNGFDIMGGKIGALNLPTLIVQEGGYLTEHLGTNLTHFLGGFTAKR